MHTRFPRPLLAAGLLGTLTLACATRSPSPTSSSSPLERATQLALVITPAWDSTAGELRRFSRTSPGAGWRPEGGAVPVVIGRKGLAWGIGWEAMAVAGEPRKREGDGRSPAGVISFDSAFGFAPADSARWLRLRYQQLTTGAECVDDTASVHYNRVVERSGVANVDWRSSERMRQVPQYRLGMTTGYNTTPHVSARGSCIFFHLWSGPRSTTAGCTALDEAPLRELMAWLDPRARPVAVQLPAAVYARLRAQWDLPPIAP